MNSQQSLSNHITELIAKLKAESQNAIDSWMEGDTKQALDLLKEIVGDGQ